jgi:6-pyruvoyl-tetrahydropterin synthase
MYAVEVREHIMIAHSFKGDVFGPAQKLHGATFIVDVAFFRQKLNAEGLVVDIGLAHEVLKEILVPLNFQNLDEVPALAGHNTTTEFLARYIFDAFAKVTKGGRLGPEGNEITRMRVTLHESHVARAWYESALGHD